MKSTTFLLSLPALSYAFPGMAGIASRDDALKQLKEMRDAAPKAPKAEEKRQLSGLLDGSALTGGLLGTLVDDVKGLLGAVAQSVNPDNKRPEPGYEFQAPGPNDSRGPCPALNLLANYGYLPRNGYVNFGQVVEATARGFNMGADLSGLLATFAVLSDGDIATESWYLGTNPANHVGGLNRHSTVEADVSPNKEDYYLGCGDNHQISSRLFRQHVALAAADPDKQFSMEVMGKQWAKNAKFSQENNPYLYFFPFPSIVALGAYPFYPNFFGNGTYGAGGVANYESISNIIGAQLNEDTGEFEFVPEKWPENWYRRDTEYGAVAALTDLLTEIYLQYFLPMLTAQLGTDNLDAATILCDVQQGLNSITPLALAGQADSATAGITWALGKLAPLGLNNTVLGCDTKTLSPNFLISNDTADGGPINPPPSVYKNTGNNVYNKVYHTTAPSNPPQCS